MVLTTRRIEGKACQRTGRSYTKNFSNCLFGSRKPWPRARSDSHRRNFGLSSQTRYSSWTANCKSRTSTTFGSVSDSGVRERKARCRSWALGLHLNSFSSCFLPLPHARQGQERRLRKARTVHMGGWPYPARIVIPRTAGGQFGRYQNSTIIRPVIPCGACTLRWPVLRVT